MKPLRNLMMMVLAATMMAACSSRTTNSEKEMNTLSFNTLQANHMTLIACNAARGDQSRLAVAVRGGLEATPGLLCRRQARLPQRVARARWRRTIPQAEVTFGAKY